MMMMDDGWMMDDGARRLCCCCFCRYTYRFTYGYTSQIVAQSTPAGTNWSQLVLCFAECADTDNAFIINQDGHIEWFADALMNSLSNFEATRLSGMTKKPPPPPPTPDFDSDGGGGGGVGAGGDGGDGGDGRDGGDGGGGGGGGPPLQQQGAGKQQQGAG